MSSVPPSSPSSFRASTRPSSHHLGMTAAPAQYHYRPSTVGSVAENEAGHIDDSVDESGVVTTTTTITKTVVRSPSRAATPRFHTPPPTLASPTKTSHVKREPTPFSASTSAAKAHGSQVPPATFQTPSPTKTPVSGHGKAKAGSSAPPKGLHRIPHPDHLPDPGYIYPQPKKWYVITTGQEVGVFSSWLDVKARTRGVPDPAHTSKPTYAQAVEEYRRQYDARQVEVVLLPGSVWANAAMQEEDEYDEEYDDLIYDDDVQYAICDAEARAAAEKAYADTMKAHGYAV